MGSTKDVLQVYKSSYTDTLLLKYMLSCCAATTSEIVTYPLDLTKTRLQMQGEKYSGIKMNGMYRGLFKTAIGIVTEEGPLNLWKGITPAIYRHLVYTGSRMVMYEYVRDRLFSTRPDGTHPVWQGIVGGIMIGGLSQFLASPTDLVKVQMQMEGRRQLEGKSPRVHSAAHAFSKIFNQGGVRGLWKGCMPNVYRSALVNLGDLTTYDAVKRFFLNCDFPDTYWTHGLSSVFSGLIGATLGTPADVVKTRVMNQATDHSGRGLIYKNSLDCLILTIKNEGFWALYKGFIPCWIRMGPWSLTFWITYEHLRSISGIAAF